MTKPFLPEELSIAIATKLKKSRYLEPCYQTASPSKSKISEATGEFPQRLIDSGRTKHHSWVYS